jgi:hypothetical protein
MEHVRYLLGFLGEALRQEVLEAFTLARVQHRRDGLGTMRRPCQALSPRLVKGLDNLTDRLDSPAHQRRHRLRQPPTGTGEPAWGTTDTAGVRCASIGLQLETRIIGQRAHKERGFHSPSLLRETPLHKNSCGDALATLIAHGTNLGIVAMGNSAIGVSVGMLQRISS